MLCPVTEKRINVIRRVASATLSMIVKVGIITAPRPTSASCSWCDRSGLDPGQHVEISEQEANVIRAGSGQNVSASFRVNESTNTAKTLQHVPVHVNFCLGIASPWVVDDYQSSPNAKRRRPAEEAEAL